MEAKGEEIFRKDTIVKIVNSIWKLKERRIRTDVLGLHAGHWWLLIKIFIAE